MSFSQLRALRFTRSVTAVLILTSAILLLWYTEAPHKLTRFLLSPDDNVSRQPTYAVLGENLNRFRLLNSTKPTEAKTFFAAAQKEGDITTRAESNSPKDEPAAMSASGNASLVDAANAVTLNNTHSDTHTRFAIIGDYGLESKEVLGVSKLVKSWVPEFIATVGDNNYPDGSMGTFDHNVGQYYQEFIYNYSGSYGAGSPEPRFFPALGNHDWASIYCTATSCQGPYFDYFDIDVSHRYYTFQRGPVRFFMMDSDSKEPDGISALSNQAVWLKEQLALSDATWNLVLLHHPPYSSGGHRSHELLQWPYAEWGADAVFSGHNHLYERIERDNMLFFVNGLGGKSRHHFRKTQPEWVQYRFNANDGAMLLEATTESITYQFYDRFGGLRDSHSVAATQADNDLHSASTHGQLSTRISHASQDATQNLRTGTVQSVGYVLELGEVQDEDPTIVGLRFADVQIPANAVIVEAHIEFSNQRRENSDTSLIISGEKACNAKPFVPIPFALAARPKTANGVHWTDLKDWELVGETNQTEDLTPIVQEIVNYQGWQSGNAMAFYIHGSGNRKAASYELQPAMAPQLRVSYDLPLTTTVPNLSPNDETDPPYQGSALLLANGIYLPMLMNNSCILN